MAACQEWETQWADARALLSIAILEDVAILIVNRRDATSRNDFPELCTAIWQSTAMADRVYGGSLQPTRTAFSGVGSESRDECPIAALD